jgi:hypothetical protein
MPDSPSVINRRGLPVIAHPCAWYGTQIQKQSDWQTELSAPERAERSPLTGLLAALTQCALPDGWPNRHVKVVVPVSTGSQTDPFSRFATEQLSKTFAHPFVFENEPAGSGSIGAMAVIKSRDDYHRQQQVPPLRRLGRGDQGRRAGPGRGTVPAVLRLLTGSTEGRLGS